jgi:hypothetical protein
LILAKDTAMTERALPRFVLIAALVAAGCQSGSVPPQSNPDQAREALTTALEAWKKGEPLDGLARRQPPIHFNDSKARETQLLDYKLEDGHTFYGQTVRIPVVLSLKRGDGSTKEKKAAYLVDTVPAVVIVPD